MGIVSNSAGWKCHVQKNDEKKEQMSSCSIKRNAFAALTTLLTGAFRLNHFDSFRWWNTRWLGHILSIECTEIDYFHALRCVLCICILVEQRWIELSRAELNWVVLSRAGVNDSKRKLFNGSHSTFIRRFLLCSYFNVILFCFAFRIWVMSWYWLFR